MGCLYVRELIGGGLGRLTAATVYAVEYVNYSSKTVVEDVYTANYAPDYFAAGTDLENACGAVAGAIVVGFYDKYYDNMVPGWNSYYTATGVYRKNDTANVGVFMRDLYSRMNTNVVAPGVSEDEFKSGLTGYINDKGYSVSYNSLGKNGSFDYGAFKSTVRNNQVSVLFVQPSYIYQIGSGNNLDAVSTTYISGNHIMVAYGYYEVEYTLSNGGTRHDVYLRVCTGWSEPTRGFYKVGSYLDSAYNVKIN